VNEKNVKFQTKNLETSICISKLKLAIYKFEPRQHSVLERLKGDAKKIFYGDFQNVYMYRTYIPTF